MSRPKKVGGNEKKASEKSLGFLGPHKIVIYKIDPVTINSRDYLAVELADHSVVVLSAADLEKQRSFEK